MRGSQLLVCPWHRPYSVAAFAADSVVRLLDRTVATTLSPFNSLLLKQLIRVRRGFTLDIFGISDEEACFAGAVLAKIAQRGFPAPCSLDLERKLLQEAHKRGLLKWIEQSESGTFVFSVQPIIEDLPQLIKASFLTELILEDEEVEALLESYRAICVAEERELFELLVKSCPDPRLALFVTPHRLLVTMVRLTRKIENIRGDITKSTVNFAIELPILSGGNWVRLAILVDSSKISQQDNELINLLKSNGWQLWHFSVAEKATWRKKADQIVQVLRTAVTDEILRAATVVRSLPLEQRKALISLILLPVAEAQLCTAIARWIHAKGHAFCQIADPQELGLQNVLNCIDQLLTHLERLYGLRHFGRPTLVNSQENADIIYFSLPTNKAWELLSLNNLTVLSPTVAFADFEDALLEGAMPKAIPTELIGTEELESNLTYFLQHLFRKVRFWDGQVKIITRALQLKPAIGLLPTAAGKSLCYQMASLLQPGFTIVVQPLRSLMWDQQDNLDAVGIHRCTAITSYAEITSDEEVHLKEEGYRAIEKGLRFFVFISPERFQIPEFREQVQAFAGSYPIPFCIVDEAHCISEWGHDFRPAYLNLGWLVPKFCAHRGFKPIFIALTATASQNVLMDILRELLIFDPDAIVTPENFDRPELRFEVIKVKSEERLAILKSLVKNLVGYRPGQPMSNLPSGLIFTYFVNDRELGAAHLRNELKNAFPEMANAIEVYCGEKPYWWLKRSDKDWELWKVKLQRRFKRNEVPVFVCTHSFGMGIDKSDIRFTIHAMLPRSLEEFYQQAGRAGRDRQTSHCYIIFSDDQPQLADEILDPVRVPIEKTGELVREIPRQQQSDVLRNIWFLRNSFIGKDSDKRILSYVWNFIKPYLPTREGDRKQIELPFDFLPQGFFERGGDLSERRQQALEKAFYRLLIIGALDDYMKDWLHKKFVISLIRRHNEELFQRFKDYLTRYATEGEVQRYLPKKLSGDYSEAVLEYAYKVVDFVYDRIERRRRRALWEMLQAARDATRLGIENFREQIKSYMTESEFTRPVKDLATRELPSEWFELLSKAEGLDGLIKLHGACRRQLEESPEHPGLLLLTGFCRLLYGEEGLRDISDAFYILKRDYPQLDCTLIAQQLIALTKERFPGKLDKVLETLLRTDTSPAMARLCYKEASPHSVVYAKALFVIVEDLLKTLREEVIFYG